MVAAPRTATLQPAGAIKVAPSAVLFGVSTASSAAGGGGADGAATTGNATAGGVAAAGCGSARGGAVAAQAQKAAIQPARMERMAPTIAAWAVWWKAKSQR
jgi:hypothetical protein